MDAVRQRFNTVTDAGRGASFHPNRLKAELPTGEAAGFQNRGKLRPGGRMRILFFSLLNHLRLVLSKSHYYVRLE